VRPYFENQFIETITHIPSGRFIAQFLKEMNVITKCDFQWEIVWKSGFVNPGNREMIGIQDWDFDTFFHNINQGLNPEVLLDEFINLISEKFVEKLKTLGCRKNDSVILAGGVATKLLRLRYLLNQEGFKIIDTESKETTLEGLAKLSAKLD
jgi:hypothetical protein